MNEPPSTHTDVNRSPEVARHTDVGGRRDVRGGSLHLVGSEEELIARAQRGDGAALREIAEREIPRIERLLGRILGPRGDFEDLVQNVLLEMCRSIAGFQGRSRFSTFVGGITVRVARRALRPSAYDARRAELLEHESLEPDPEQVSSAAQRLALLHQRLDRLTPAKRIAFSLWALDERTPEEIAALTDAKVHTVRSRIFHARQELMHDQVVRALLGRAP
ncbi:MAG: RNA polymerase sigma factor [Sandaracinaceae bacterium]